MREDDRFDIRDTGILPSDVVIDKGREVVSEEDEGIIKRFQERIDINVQRLQKEYLLSEKEKEKMKKAQLGSWFIGVVIVVILIWFVSTRTGEDIGEINITGKVKVLSEKILDEIKTPIIKKPDVSLISKCINSFNQCNDISYKKYGVRISISEKKEFNDIEEAEEFYNIWIGRLEDWDGVGKHIRQQKINESGFPQVLIAYSTKLSENNLKFPSIAICNNSGELTDYSKKALACG